MIRTAAIGFSAILVLSAWSVPRCSAEKGASASLKLGVLLPPDEPQARSVREGVLLAQEQASETPGDRFEVTIRGRVGQWGTDAGEAARLVIDEGVAGLIAPPDGAASHLVLQVSGRTAVPVVSLCADSSVSRTGVPWLFRVVPRTEEEAKVLFEAVSGPLPGKRYHWAAVVPEGRAGRELSHDLGQVASAGHYDLEPIIEAASSGTSADNLRASILGSHPDGVLIWLDPVSAGRLAKDLRANGYLGRLAGPGRLHSDDFISAAGDAMDGFLIPIVKRDDESAALWGVFQTTYRARWAHEPDSMAAMSYDAARLLSHLLRQTVFQAPPHRLPTGFSWPGVTGKLSFDSGGNRKVELGLLQGHAGRFTPVPTPK